MAYRVAMRLSSPNWAEHSMAREHSLVWNKIWSLNVPPKVRTFLWRACSNCLPTRDNLHQRRVSVEPHCEICHHKSETVSHILWECPLARNVWAFLKAGLRSATTQPQIFSSFFINCNWKWTSTSWRGGQSRCGQSGMQEIDYTSSISRLTQRWYLNLQADWSWNTNIYSTRTELTTVTYSGIGSLISSLEPNAEYVVDCTHFFKSMKAFYRLISKKKKKKINTRTVVFVTRIKDTTFTT